MSESASAAARRHLSAWSPLALPTFRAVWIASVVANIGVWLGNVGTAWLMTELKPTPVMVTLVQTAASLPVFLFALPAGAVGDLVDRRALLVLLQVVSALLSVLLGLSTWLALTTPGVILVASFLFGTVLAFGMPVFQAIVPDLVPRHELAPAVSLNSIGINVARVIGPAVGGFLILGCGVAVPFFVNTIFYLMVIGLLLQGLPRLTRDRAGGEPIFTSVITGLRYTFGDGEVRATLVRSAGYAFCANIFFALLPLIAKNRVGGGPGTYGLLLGCLGAGGIVSVLILPRLRAVYVPDRIARAGSLASAALLLLVAASDSLWMVVPVLLAAGFAWVAVVATVNVAAQTTLPSWVRARGLSIFMIVFNGMMALGSACWGFVADLTGIPLAIAASGAALLAFDAATIRWRLPGDDRVGR